MSLWDRYIAGGGFAPPKKAPKGASSAAAQDRLEEMLQPTIGGGMTGLGLPPASEASAALAEGLAAEASTSNVVPFPTTTSSSSSSGRARGGSGSSAAPTTTSSSSGQWTDLLWLGALVVGGAAAVSLVVRIVRG